MQRLSFIFALALLLGMGHVTAAALTSAQKAARDEIKKTGDEMVARVDRFSIEYDDVKEDHAAALAKSRTTLTKKVADLMEETSDGDREVKAACESSSPEDCELEIKYHRESSEAKIIHLNQEIHERFSFIFSQYIDALTKLHLTSFRGRDKMASQVEHIANVKVTLFAGINSPQAIAFFADQETKLLDALDRLNGLNADIEMTISNAKSSLFENICIEFNGVDSEITSKEHEKYFYQHVGNALGLAYSEGGMNIELINFQIKDQHFEKYHSGRTRRRLSGGNQGKLKVRSGAMWECECEGDGDPTGDAYRRRELTEDDRRVLWGSAVEANFHRTVERHMKGIFPALTSVKIIPCSSIE